MSLHNCRKIINKTKNKTVRKSLKMIVIKKLKNNFKNVLTNKRGSGMIQLQTKKKQKTPETESQVKK